MEELKKKLDSIAKREKTLIILTGVAVIVIIIMIVSLFSIFRKRDDVSMEYQQKLAALESERAAIVRERSAWNTVVDQQQQTIVMLTKKDSTLLETIKRTNAQIKQLDNETNKISDRIRTYGSPELKRAFADFR